MEGSAGKGSAGKGSAGKGSAGKGQGECPIHHYDSTTLTVTPPLPAIDALISLAPLPGIDEILHLVHALGIPRIIAFGSTGVFSKAASSSELERDFVRDQLDAERRLATAAQAAGVRWTLFRPTMIYGAGLDQNVTFIRSMIRRFHLFPLPIGARGLRQPVHVADLAQACVKALGNPVTFDQAYNLGGGEVIEYPEMVRRICQADGRAARLLPLPAFLYRWLVRAANRFPGLGYLRDSMVDRMFADLITDNADAIRDFGYSPRGFQPPGPIRQGS